MTMESEALENLAKRAAELAGKSETDAIEILKKAMDIAEDTNWYYFDKKAKRGFLIAGLMIGSGIALAAGTTGYLIANKRLDLKYQQISKDEIKEAHDFYARFYKKDDFETPQAAAESLGVQAAVDALDKYQGNITIEREEVEVEVTPVTKTRNIFTDSVPEDSVWDLEQEISNRTEDEPYVISQDEFYEGDRDYRQITLSYFAEDDVLVDEQEKPIEEVDNVVGEGNLTRFGHGSNDNRIVYIRNDRLAMDFEVVKNEGSYSREVLGFQHGDAVGRKAQLRKFRGDDD